MLCFIPLAHWTSPSTTPRVLSPSVHVLLLLTNFLRGRGWRSLPTATHQHPTFDSVLKTMEAMGGSKAQGPCVSGENQQWKKSNLKSGAQMEPSAGKTRSLHCQLPPLGREGNE